jgi:hypothetical protein
MALDDGGRIVLPGQMCLKMPHARVWSPVFRAVRTNWATAADFAFRQLIRNQGAWRVFLRANTWRGGFPFAFQLFCEGLIFANLFSNKVRIPMASTYLTKKGQPSPAGQGIAGDLQLIDFRGGLLDALVSEMVLGWMQRII